MILDILLIVPGKGRHQCNMDLKFVLVTDTKLCDHMLSMNCCMDETPLQLVTDTDKIYCTVAPTHPVIQTNIAVHIKNLTRREM